MKTTTSHSMIKPILRLLLFFFLSWSEHNNYFEHDTFYNSFIVRFCWNLLALANIYANGK